jgi:hypothetical protein
VIIEKSRYEPWQVQMVVVGGRIAVVGPAAIHGKLDATDM